MKYKEAYHKMDKQELIKQLSAVRRNIEQVRDHTPTSGETAILRNVYAANIDGLNTAIMLASQLDEQTERCAEIDEGKNEWDNH